MREIFRLNCGRRSGICPALKPDAIRRFGCGDIFRLRNSSNPPNWRSRHVDAISSNERHRIAKALGVDRRPRADHIHHRLRPSGGADSGHSVGRGCNSCLVQASLRAKRRARRPCLNRSTLQSAIRNPGIAFAPLTLGFRALDFLTTFLCLPYAGHAIIRAHSFQVAVCHGQLDG